MDLAQFETAGGLQEVRQEFVRLSFDVKPLMLLSSSNLVASVVGDMELIAEAQLGARRTVPLARVDVDRLPWRASTSTGSLGARRQPAPLTRASTSVLDAWNKGPFGSRRLDPLAYVDRNLRRLPLSARVAPLLPLRASTWFPWRASTSTGSSVVFGAR